MTRSDDDVAAMWPAAAALAVAVADRDPEGVREVLEPLDRDALQLVAVLLADHVDVDTPPPSVWLSETATINTAIAAVAGTYDLTPDEVRSRTRQRHIFEARAVAMAAAHRAGLSIVAVARHFGRDHTTVSNALAFVRARPVLAELADYVVSTHALRRPL